MLITFKMQGKWSAELGSSIGAVLSHSTDSSELSKSVLFYEMCTALDFETLWDTYGDTDILQSLSRFLEISIEKIFNISELNFRAAF